MSAVWTPGQSPFHPCQRLKHLPSNHCSDSRAVGYMFPLLLSWQLLWLLRHLVLCQPSQLPWINFRFCFALFFRFVFLPLSSRHKPAFSIPSFRRPQHSGILLSILLFLFLFLYLCLFLVLRTWIKQVLLQVDSWSQNQNSDSLR